MSSQSESADRSKEGSPTPHALQPDQEHSKASQVLEMAKNLIIEIQRFKVYNK